MTHPARIALTALAPFALAFATFPTPAFAQEEIVEAKEPDDAERAFLDAYYLELGKKQHAEALAAYRQLIEDHPASAVRARTFLGIARTLQSLGRRDEARQTLLHLRRTFAADASVTAAADALAKALAGQPDDDLDVLVRAALQEDSWETRAPGFGGRAVPVLAKLLRAADPSLVYRAGKSLLRIGTDEACDALLDGLTADDVLYPERISTSALSRGPFPERLGTGVLALDDTELRNKLVAQAIDCSAPGYQVWLIDAVLTQPWALEIAFPSEAIERAGTASLIVRAVAEGPGAPRDAALAHLQLYTPRRKRRGRNREPELKYTGSFFNPSAVFLADRDALRRAAQHVYAEDGSSDPSEALRDALLADPETRELGLHWTWRYKMPCRDRDLLLDAVTASTTPVPLSNFLAVIRASFHPSPSGAEWRRILTRDDFDSNSVGEMLNLFEEDGQLPTSTLDAFLEAGHAETVLSWLERRKRPDDAWAAAALPPLLKSDRPAVAVAAGQLLAGYHWAGRIDISGHLPELVALFRHDRVWSANMVILVMVQRMGDAGPAAMVEATPLGTRGDQIIMDRLLAAERPEASVVAERLLMTPIAEDDRKRIKDLEHAVWVMLTQRGDDAVPSLIRAVRIGSLQQSVVVAQETWRRRELSTAGSEAFTASLIEDPVEGLNFPDWIRLEPEALRRLALRALESDVTTLQRWGAVRQQTLLDAKSAARLGGLADATDPRVRSAARDALNAMRKADQDMAWMRAVAARQQTRGKVDRLLESRHAVERMAGVAGLVALRAPDALERLLDVAAKDTDADVRAEARRALLALGDRQGDGPADKE